MKYYLCLGYYDPDVFDALSADEKEALAERCAPHDEELGFAVEVRPIDRMTEEGA